MSQTGQRLYQKARRLIPGGTQLLSKQPERFLPGEWPTYYSRAKGAWVWDLDNRKYVDMSYNGLGACLLGAGDPDVDEAVRSAIAAGSISTLNCPEEVELAELLCGLHPWADMVRYARGGGEAMAVAVRIARAATGREKIAFCGYHGWHDWYLAANLAGIDHLDGHLLPGLKPLGVPSGLVDTAIPFTYNRIDELEAIASRYPHQLAAVVMEPARHYKADPGPGFLEGVRRMASRAGAALVFDEVSVGFRMITGGIHLTYGVEPDLAVLAKGMSNGYPMAAIIGRREFMEAAERTFISSTYWTDRLGPAAALATIRKHAEQNVAARLIEVGRRVQDAWREAAQRTGLPVEVGGLIPPLSYLRFQVEQPLEVRTLYTRLMLERGFLASGDFYATFAHTDEQIEQFTQAIEDVFAVIAKKLAQSDGGPLIKGPAAGPTLRQQR